MVISRHYRKLFHQQGTHPVANSFTDDIYPTVSNVPPDLHGSPQVTNNPPSESTHSYNLRSIGTIWNPQFLISSFPQPIYIPKICNSSRLDKCIHFIFNLTTLMRVYYQNPRSIAVKRLHLRSCIYLSIIVLLSSVVVNISLLCAFFHICGDMCGFFSVKVNILCFTLCHIYINIYS